MRAANTLLILLPMALHAQPAANLGPDAPDLSVGYAWDSGFTFVLSNSPASNNYNEQYAEAIIPAESSADPFWRFQGYAVMQFATPTDADDSIAWVVRDMARARPVILTDLADGVAQMEMVIDPSGPADCVPLTWVLLNSGVEYELQGALDVFDGQPYDPFTTYCFTALAFGFNPYHLDSDCDEPEQAILSTRAPMSGLVAHCVTGVAVGVEEAERMTIGIGPVPANDVVRVSGISPGGARTRVLDAAGALVHEGNMHDGDALTVGTWAEGMYTMQFNLTDGRSTVKRFVVMHD